MVLTLIVTCIVVSVAATGNLTFVPAENSAVSSEEVIVDEADNVAYVVDEDGVLTCEYIDDSVTEITIPDEVDGIKVTAIGSSAFCKCTSLTSITIPDSVTKIGDNVFNGCHGLTIYCRVGRFKKPRGWKKDWNCGCKVVWGYKGK